MGGKNSYESIKRYQDKAYDKILVRLPKGQKDTIQAHAEARKESVNGFVNRAISEAVERDSSPMAPAHLSPQAPETPQGGALVLMERGQVSTDGGAIRMLYTVPDTGREYYVEPVISDDEWDTLQKAKGTNTDSPNELPF